MSEFYYNKPLPRLTALNTPFWEMAKKGVLAVQTCLECDDMHAPPGPVCPHCLAVRQTWRAISGWGTLESLIEVHRAYWEGFASELPYRVCLVRLDEGPVLISTLVGDAAGARLGSRLVVVFEPATDTLVIPKFRLAEGWADENPLADWTLDEALPT